MNGARGPEGYELLGPLAHGGPHGVWLAKERGALARTVVIKRVQVPGDAEAAARIVREAEMLASLDHPHVVRLLDVLPDGEGIAIVTVHAAGGTLADRLTGGVPLPPADVVGIATGVADALASAHRRGLVHGDVKPANILLTSDSEPLLADFGIARDVAAEGPSGVGTIDYLDPRVASGAPPDAGSDVYGLAVVCYQALSGVLPYPGTTFAEVLRAAEEGRAKSLGVRCPHLPSALTDAVMRGMVRDRDRRFTGAAQFAAALRGAAAQLPGAVRDADPEDAGAVRSTEVSEVARSLDTPALDSAPTQPFGPPPPRPVQAPPAPRAPWRAAGALAAILTALFCAGAASGRLGSTRTATAATAGVTVAGADSSAAGSTGQGCAAVEKQPGQVAADVDGNGCAEAVSWEGGVMTVSAAGRAGAASRAERYAIGKRGDQLLLGDWNCDGRSTPAVYRPGTGQVFQFQYWPRSGDRVISGASRDGSVRGVAEVDRDGGGCDTVRVHHR